jgi:hypothetical protein
MLSLHKIEREKEHYNSVTSRIDLYLFAIIDDEKGTNRDVLGIVIRDYKFSLAEKNIWDV